MTVKIKHSWADVENVNRINSSEAEQQPFVISQEECSVSPPLLGILNTEDKEK